MEPIGDKRGERKQFAHRPELLPRTISVKPVKSTLTNLGNMHIYTSQWFCVEDIRYLVLQQKSTHVVQAAGIDREERVPPPLAPLECFRLFLLYLLLYVFTPIRSDSQDNCFYN